MAGTVPIRKIEDLQLFLDLLSSRNELYGNFCRVQLSWGLRFSDCANITVDDARNCLQHGYVKLTERKTGKGRLCSLNDRVAPVLRAYAGQRDDGLLWGRNIVRETYNLKLKEIAIMMGMDYKRISSHTLRKSFAYLLVHHYGIPIEKVSQQMGHSSVAYTRIYAGLAEDELLSLTKLGL